MLAGNWRVPRPKPIGGPASDGRTTHCCTKCSRRWAAGASPCLLATRCIPSPGSSSFMPPTLTSSGLALPLKPLAGFATWPTTNLGFRPVRVAEDCRFSLNRRRISRRASRRNRGRSGAAREPCGRFSVKSRSAIAAAVSSSKHLVLWTFAESEPRIEVWEDEGRFRLIQGIT